MFALSRAGYLPKSLSVTSERKVPSRALIIPGVFGFLASLSGEGDLMLAMAVVGATVSYALMALRDQTHTHQSEQPTRAPEQYPK